MLSALPAKQQNTTYTNYEKADASWFKKKKKKDFRFQDSNQDQQTKFGHALLK